MQEAAENARRWAADETDKNRRALYLRTADRLDAEAVTQAQKAAEQEAAAAAPPEAEAAPTPAVQGPQIDVTQAVTQVAEWFSGQIEEVVQAVKASAAAKMQTDAELAELKGAVDSLLVTALAAAKTDTDKAGELEEIRKAVSALMAGNAQIAAALKKDDTKGAIDALIARNDEILEALTAPKKVIFNEQGRPIGIEPAPKAKPKSKK